MRILLSLIFLINLSVAIAQPSIQLKFDFGQLNYQPIDTVIFDESFSVVYKFPNSDTIVFGNQNFWHQKSGKWIIKTSAKEYITGNFKSGKKTGKWCRGPKWNQDCWCDNYKRGKFKWTCTESISF